MGIRYPVDRETGTKWKELLIIAIAILTVIAIISCDHSPTQMDPHPLGEGVYTGIVAAPFALLSLNYYNMCVVIGDSAAYVRHGYEPFIGRINEEASTPDSLVVYYNWEGMVGTYYLLLDIKTEFGIDGHIILGEDIPRKFALLRRDK